MKMTPLERILREMITAEGPISLSRYMALCLGHPRHGYYATRDPLGTDGDFTTAPEISQLFGELVGAWLLKAWRDLGCPLPIALVELGPGRGTLMADIWRVLRAEPALAEGANVHLVETSPALRAKQAEMLARLGVGPAHHDDVTTLPYQPILFVANEFFDALPTNQWQKIGPGWCERKIGLTDEGNFTFGLDRAAGPPPKRISPHLPDGTILEHSPAQDTVMMALADHVQEQGGAGLIIDYGSLRTGSADTLQAVRDHQPADPLLNAGEADLTTHVDFEHLAGIAKAQGIAGSGGATQGDFLLRLGLLERAGQLGAGKAPDEQHAISAAVERLAGDAAMGKLFKVLGLASQPIPMDGLETGLWDG